MKVYKNQNEVEKDIKDGVLAIEGDVKFECSISILVSIIVTAGDITARDINAGDITAWNINARNINARNITAWNINARNITAWNINARNITAWNINARNITAWNINARNITAGDINARDINAGDILYYAFCCVYRSIKCTSIKAKRDIHQEPICLEGKLEITKETKNPKEIVIDGAIYVLKESL